MSICQTKRTSCRDEDSLYHFKRVANSDEFELQADKIVDGKIVTMGTNTCRYNAERKLICAIPESGVMLSFDVKGDGMSGIMTMPDGTAWRKLILKRVRK